MYLQKIQDKLNMVTEWGARVHVVLREAATALGDAMPARGIPEFLIDPNAKLPADPPAVIIADEWGEVYCSLPGGEAHEFPSTQELADWARFIAIQCPECEQPEGEWKAI